MGIFFDWGRWGRLADMGHWLGKKGDRVVIDQDGIPIPPPPAKLPSEGHYVTMNYTPANFDLIPSYYIRNSLPVVTPNELTAMMAIPGLNSSLKFAACMGAVLRS